MNPVHRDSGVEANMLRLKRLREYRSRIFNDMNSRVDKYIAAGMPPKQAPAVGEYVRKCQLRIRIMNDEIDRVIESDPRVLRPATA